MKKLVFILSIFLLACGSEESTEEEGIPINEYMNSLEEEEEDVSVEEPVEPAFDPTIVSGHWVYDMQANVDFKAKSEEEKVMSELDVMVLQGVYKPFFLDLNEDMSYEFQTANNDLCGVGRWSMNEDQTVLTLDHESSDPVDYVIVLMDDNRLHLNNPTEEYDYNFFFTHTALLDQK